MNAEPVRERPDEGWYIISKCEDADFNCHHWYQIFLSIIYASNKLPSSIYAVFVSVMCFCQPTDVGIEIDHHLLYIIRVSLCFVFLASHYCYSITYCDYGQNYVIII